jgi:hypothetical protein
VLVGGGGTEEGEAEAAGAATAVASENAAVDNCRRGRRNITLPIAVNS